MLSQVVFDSVVLGGEFEIRMDTVQLNNEVIRMRKTIKKVKVQALNHLIRQVRLLRNKKGKPEQLEKNRKRCDRLLDEVQAIKDWPLDDVTYAALAREHTVVNQKKLETSRERALSRLLRHRLFVQQFASFKDSVTLDLLQIKRKNKGGAHLNANKSDVKLHEVTSDRSPKAGAGIEMSRKASPLQSEEDDDCEEDSADDEALFFLPSKQSKLEDSRSNSTTSNEDEIPGHHSNPLIPPSKTEGAMIVAPRGGVNSSPKQRRNARTGLSVTPTASVSASMIARKTEDTSGGWDSTNALDKRIQKEEKMIAPMVDLPFLMRKEPKQKYIPGISAPAAVEQKYIPGISAPSAAEQKYKPGISAPAAVEQKYIPGISAPSAAEQKYKPGISAPAAAEQKYIPGITSPVEPEQKYIPGISAPVKPEQKYIPGISAPAAAEQKYIPGITSPVKPEQKYIPGISAPVKPKQKYIPGISAPAAVEQKYIPGIIAPSAAEQKYKPGISAPAAAEQKYIPGITSPVEPEQKYIPGISAPVKPEQKYIPGISAPAAREAAEHTSGRGRGSVGSRRLTQVHSQKRKKPPGGRKNNLGSYAVKDTTVPEEQNLHPSWQARKAQKERETLSVGFAGKKITFDND